MTSNSSPQRGKPNASSPPTPSTEETQLVELRRYVEAMRAFDAGEPSDTLDRSRFGYYFEGKRAVQTITALLDRITPAEGWNREARLTLDHLSGMLQAVGAPHRTDWREWITEGQKTFATLRTSLTGAEAQRDLARDTERRALAPLIEAALLWRKGQESGDLNVKQAAGAALTIAVAPYQTDRPKWVADWMEANARRERAYLDSEEAIRAIRTSSSNHHVVVCEHPPLDHTLRGCFALGRLTDGTPICPCTPTDMPTTVNGEAIPSTPSTSSASGGSKPSSSNAFPTQGGRKD